MSVLYKAGVCGDPHPMIQKAIGRIHDQALPSGYDLVITSLREGKHKAGSLHPIGRAADIRPICRAGNTENPTIHHLSVALVMEAVADVSPYFQTIHEGDHIHIEYDPPEGAL